jgi:hypothetical protein
LAKESLVSELLDYADLGHGSRPPHQSEESARVYHRG